MSDTTISNSENLPSSAPTPSERPSITLNQTRSFTWEFLLTFSTFSFYSIFYLIRTTSELNKIGGKRFTPWLWIFSLSPLISIFSLPKLHSALNRLEAEHQSPHPSKWHIATIVVMILSNIYLTVSAKLSTPLWTDFIVLLIWSASFASFAQRIAALKHAVDNVDWNPENIIKKVFRWLFSLTIVPLYIFTTGYELVEFYQIKDVTRFDANQTYTISNDQRIQLTFVEEGWYQAEIGTYSDGTADAEFGGPNLSTHLILFSYDNLESIDAHLHERRAWLEENISVTSCTQDKKLLPNSMTVKSELICKGRSINEEEVGISILLETEQRVYELIGIYSAPEYEFKLHNDDFYQMIEEFKPL